MGSVVFLAMTGGGVALVLRGLYDRAHPRSLDALAAPHWQVFAFTGAGVLVVDLALLALVVRAQRGSAGRGEDGVTAPPAHSQRRRH